MESSDIFILLVLYTTTAVFLDLRVSLFQDHTSCYRINLSVGILLCRVKERPGQ